MPELTKTTKVKPSKPLVIVVGLAIVAAALLVVLLAIQTYRITTMPQVVLDPEKYYAVFLTNGQVYFGHLTELQSGYLALTDIYYLQIKQPLHEPAPPQERPAEERPAEERPAEERKEGEAVAPGTQPELSLIKLGEELHGPEDLMIINRDQVLFFEPLKEDGQVVKAIREHKKR